MPWRITEYQGKLALTMGCHPSWNEPYLEQEFIVSKVDFTDYADLDGLIVEFTGNTGLLIHNRKRYIFQTDDSTQWHRTKNKKKVAMPRKKGDWEWRHGQWRRR